MHGVHSAASAGFGEGAEAYVRGRPEYPHAVAMWLRHDLAIGPGSSVLDLGAGTGKFTRRLVATGANVIAVEPVAAMAEQLRRQHLPVDLREGSAESIPLRDASLDAVLCAQAFHWFATPAALQEIRRVLKPGGHLGLVWNVRDVRVPWVAGLTKILRAHEEGTPRYDTFQWRNLFPAPGFTALEPKTFAHAHIGDPEHVIVDRVLSVSFIAKLPLVDRQQVAQRLRNLIATTPELCDQASITFPYTTETFHCSKLLA